MLQLTSINLVHMYWSTTSGWWETRPDVEYTWGAQTVQKLQRKFMTLVHQAINAQHNTALTQQKCRDITNRIDEDL